MQTITRLFDFLYYQKDHQPVEKAFGHKVDGKWEFYSTDDVIRLSQQLAHGFLKLGLKKGDKVAIVVAKNRPEWVVCDFAMSQIGLINVPVYPTITQREYEYIFNEASVQYCFTDGEALHGKVAKAMWSIPTLKGIFTYDKTEGATHWSELFREGDFTAIKAISDTIQPEELATIIYTSGTTGDPKGVMLSHKNIVSNVLSVLSIIPIRAGNPVISFLPLNHIFERSILYGYTHNSVQVHFTGTDNLGGENGDLRDVKPVFFTTVPRLLEKVYEKIVNTGLALTGVKRKLFFWALKLTESYQFDKEPSGFDAIQWKIADKLIFSKWRVALGGNIDGIIVGASPCPMRIAQVFSAAGIPIREGYGLTETSPGLAIGRFEKGGAKLGVVGPVIPNVVIKIDNREGIYREEEGEILACGDNVMMGYYKKQDATDAVISEIEGKRWLHTGDIGRFIPNPSGGAKFLQITDRKKELLKTSGGKYIAPAPIESKLKEDFLIDQAMVVGDNMKFASALIVPAADALKDWCNNNSVEWTTMKAVIANPKVRAMYQNIVDAANPSFSHVEQVKKFALIDFAWEPMKADGSEAELTPTMKLKRRVITQKCQKQIDEMYAG
jgi:long-chain acyl-CoA synthetase